MKPKHRFWFVRGAILTIAVVSLAVPGCGNDEMDTGRAAVEPVMMVGSENVAIARIAELRSGPAISGSLQPRHEARVRAELAGPVEQTFAEEGQRVRRGALLARLDDTAVRDAHLSARSAVRTAESSLQNAQRNLERATRLAEAGALPERDLETARFNATSAEGALADARARLAAAEKQLAQTVVRAPIAGVISERQADAGDVVQAGAELFRIVDLGSLRLEGAVPAAEIDRLKPGMPVDFAVSGYDRRFTGKVERINPSVDPATGQVRIYVSVPNEEESLVAGLFAEGRVATDTRKATSVPQAAVDQRGTEPLVHLLQGGRVKYVPVRLGVRDESTDLVEVASGIAPGDTVLLGSAQGVAEGAQVRVSAEDARR